MKTSYIILLLGAFAALHPSSAAQSRRLWLGAELNGGYGVYEANNFHGYGGSSDSGDWNDMPTTSLYLSAGYDLLPRLSLAAVTGLTRFAPPTLVSIPLMAEARLGLRKEPEKRTTRWSLYARGGIPIILGQKEDCSGSVAGAGISSCIGWGGRTCLRLSLGWEMQHYRYRNTAGHYNLPTRHSVQIGMGFIFR